MRVSQVEAHLPLDELAVWVREAADKGGYQRRLAVWLTLAQGLPAQQVAQYLCVSRQSVWKWLGEYDKLGPEALERQGRGGRRWGFLTFSEEVDLLAGFLAAAERGQVLTASVLKHDLERRLQREVSLAYVYRLLSRHGWRKLSPRPRHHKSSEQQQAVFKKNSRR